MDKTDQLEADEALYGAAFVDSEGERVEPEKVFKNQAGSFTDYNGNPVRLWKSEVNAR